MKTLAFPSKLYQGVLGCHSVVERKRAMCEARGSRVNTYKERGGEKKRKIQTELSKAVVQIPALLFTGPF